MGKHETKFGTIYYKDLNLQRPFHGSIRSSFVCELWLLEWHWDEVFSKHFDLRLSVILPMRHTLQYNLTN